MKAVPLTDPQSADVLSAMDDAYDFNPPSGPPVDREMIRK